MKFGKLYRTAAFCGGLTMAAVAPVGAQRQPAPVAPPTSAGSSSTGVGTSNSSRNTTLNNSSSTNPNTDLSRPIFLSGKVLFDDGSPANTDVRIERVCRGNPRVETHTDSRGDFSFQVGGSSSFDVSSADASSNSGLGSSVSSNPFGGSSSNSSNANNLFDCELRAAYPGYVSETVSLANRHSLDDPNVGTIFLHSLRNVKGTTISMTSAMAPKMAQKDFQKGMQAAQKGKFEEAEGKFEDATKEYPKYAEAWFHLGQVQERLNKPADAMADYMAAISADSKFVNPYDKLAHLSASQNSWKEAEKFSRQATDLNPVEFPSSFWYNAIANYNLKNDAEAEKSARALVKLDRRHAYPDAERLLADLTSSRGDLTEAAVHLKAYLAESPNAAGTEKARKQLARIEEVQAAQAGKPTIPSGGAALAGPPK